MLVIDPEVCIDCNLCVPQCPIDAIFEEKNLPSEQAEWKELNAVLSKKWPVLTEQKDPLPDWKEWDKKPGKRELLKE